MRAHQIENGMVVNTIEVGSLDSIPDMTLIEAIQGGIGWLWDGESLSPPAALAPVVPQKVTRRQGRQALLLAGKLDLVPLTIAAIEDETKRRLAQIEWEDAQDFERQRPLVIEMGAALGLDLDALFIQAAAL